MSGMYISMKKIEKKYGGPLCRACLRELSGVHLSRRECWYMPFQGLCPRCHMDGKNLVGKLKLSGKLHTIFG